MAEKVDYEDLKEHNVYHSEVLVNKDLMVNAFDGENREHQMGVWEATKTHPMACLWAFIMCFTIVSADSTQSRSCVAQQLLTLNRSWNPLICS